MARLTFVYISYITNTILLINQKSMYVFDMLGEDTLLIKFFSVVL